MNKADKTTNTDGHRQAAPIDLSTQVAGLHLANPLMPASGPLVGDDRKMIAIAASGVGAMVSKTISQAGAVVPRPCIWGDRTSIMNAELWSEYPAAEWIDNFLPATRRALPGLPLILSVGYSQADMEALISRLEPFADAFEISTHYVGKNLDDIARTVATIRRLTGKPFFMKLSPHLPDPVAFARMVLDQGGSGVVAINSLGPTLKIDLASRAILVGNAQGEVWMSGPAIKPLALALVRRIKDAIPECVVIGTGGVASAEDVIEFLLAGADAVQMLSAAMLKGRDLYRKILEALPAALAKYGFASVAEARATRLKPMAVRMEPRPPVFDQNRCTACLLCEEICPYFAIGHQGKAMQVDPSACFGCGLCQSRCPVNAISGVY